MKKILTQYGVCALAVALMVTLAPAQAQTPAPRGRNTLVTSCTFSPLTLWGSKVPSSALLS
jgi:hypothetical protein